VAWGARHPKLGAVDIGYVHGSTPLDLLAIARVAAKQGDLATASKLLRDALRAYGDWIRLGDRAWFT
jgi:hypothetical protein